MEDTNDFTCDNFREIDECANCKHFSVDAESEMWGYCKNEDQEQPVVDSDDWCRYYSSIES